LIYLTVRRYRLRGEDRKGRDRLRGRWSSYPRRLPLGSICTWARGRGCGL